MRHELGRKGVKAYVGLKGTMREVFLSDVTPDPATYKGKYGAYDSIIGPFRTRVGAEYMAHFGWSQGCKTIEEAERKAAAPDSPMRGTKYFELVTNMLPADDPPWTVSGSDRKWVETFVKGRLRKGERIISLRKVGEGPARQAPRLTR